MARINGASDAQIHTAACLKLFRGNVEHGQPLKLTLRDIDELTERLEEPSGIMMREWELDMLPEGGANAYLQPNERVGVSYNNLGAIAAFKAEAMVQASSYTQSSVTRQAMPGVEKQVHDLLPEDGAALGWSTKEIGHAIGIDPARANRICKFLVAKGLAKDNGFKQNVRYTKA